MLELSYRIVTREDTALMSLTIPDENLAAFKLKEYRHQLLWVLFNTKTDVGFESVCSDRFHKAMDKTLEVHQSLRGAVSTGLISKHVFIPDNLTVHLVATMLSPSALPVQVPRVALAASKFGGLLSYPAKPGKTVFFLNISKAAGMERSLFWTFGTGVPERSCPFKPFMMSFLKDVQKQLQP